MFSIGDTIEFRCSGLSSDIGMYSFEGVAEVKGAHKGRLWCVVAPGSKNNGEVREDLYVNGKYVENFITLNEGFDYIKKM